MEQEIRLLKELFEQAQMGVFTLSLLLKKRQEGHFAFLLKRERRLYLQQARTLCRALQQVHVHPRGLSLFARKRTAWAVSLELLCDPSVSHIAEMLILGSTMGIIHALRCAKQYAGAEESLGQPAKAMAREEENRIRLWKRCL